MRGEIFQDEGHRNEKIQRSDCFTCTRVIHRNFGVFHLQKAGNNHDSTGGGDGAEHDFIEHYDHDRNAGRHDRALHYDYQLLTASRQSGRSELASVRRRVPSSCLVVAFERAASDALSLHEAPRPLD